MRHGRKFNHLGRKVGHRKALLRNMASSLILHKRINTTLAKAKALQQYVEPIINRTKGNEVKEDKMNASRMAFRYLQDKTAVKELFENVAEKVAERNGGYTRIIKLGTRLGDNAELAMIELVDFNTLYTQNKGAASTKKKRRRRGGKSGETETTASAVEVIEENTIVETSAEITNEDVVENNESESENDKKEE